jgi:hypothetical protein
MANKKNNTLLVVGILAAVGIAYVVMNKGYSVIEQTNSATVQNARAWVIDYLTRNNNSYQFNDTPFRQMNDAEIVDVYNWLQLNGNYQNAPADLKARINVISDKYNVFN